MTFVEKYGGKYVGQTGYIVGKGPSLHYLDSSYFGDGPVITMNDAILVVQELCLRNPIYSLQKDGQPEFMVRPKFGCNIILMLVLGYSEFWFPNYTPREYIDILSDLNFNDVRTMSIRLAVKILKIMQCEQIVFLCCDSLEDRRELRTYNPRTKTADIHFPCAAHYDAVIDVLAEELQDIIYHIVTPKEKENV